jgi:ABC-type multidrug transport system ATPase subunit
VHAELRARYLDTSANIAYCGQEFRVYRSMKIADAARFYAALNTKWDATKRRQPRSYNARSTARNTRSSRIAAARAITRRGIDDPRGHA